MPRIDKLFSESGILTRSQCLKAIKSGRITIDGVKVKSPSIKVEDENLIELDGKKIEFKKFVYIMLNKPSGVISASEDGKEKTVIDILPKEFVRKGLFPCGRLDKDTVGLVIITNDGKSSHKNLSPKNHAEKVYFYKCAEILSENDVLNIENGVLLKDGYKTKPCKLKVIDDYSGEITLTEGKYHEIKRIFGSLGNKITYLKRISFKGIALDSSLEEGQSRYLTEEELSLFLK